MMFYRIAFFILICSTGLSVQAQNQQSGWLATFNTFRLNPSFSMHLDAQLRSTDALEHVQTFLLRPGINYHFNKKFSSTLGYAFVHNRRSSGTITGYVTEHRIWEQVLFSHKWLMVSTSHRLRYFMRNLVPLQNKNAFTKGWFAALQNEIFLNVTNKDAVNGKVFDQNRFYAAVGYRMGKIDLEAGYLNQYTKTVSSTLTNHIVQLAVYKRL